MAVKVEVNGLSMVHKGSEGKATSTIPDFCKTPVGTSTPPLPYTNISESKDVSMGSILTSADGGNSIALQFSQFSKSSGDAPGVCGGVASGGTEGKTFLYTASPDVKIEGRGVCRKTDKGFMNDFNTICLGGVSQADIEWPYTWIKFKVVKSGTEEPLKGVKFKITLPDGSETKSVSVGHGIIRVSGIEEGSCDIILDEADNPRYDRIDDDSTNTGLGTAEIHTIGVILNDLGGYSS